MIDNLSIVLTHGLMLVAAWRLLRRPDLDREGPAPFARFGRRPGSSAARDPSEPRADA